MRQLVFRVDKSCVDTPDARTLFDFNSLRISPEFLIDKPGILFIGLSIISNYDVIIDFCIDSA